NGKKPQPDFMEEITNAFTEAKDSISSAFTEMRSESPKADKQGDDNASRSDAPKTTFADVNKQAKEMGASRPVPLPADQGGGGKIAGVAEGIAVRYQIDATLVRVIFVVTAFCWGGSIALYLLAWMFMPRYSKTPSPFEDAFGEKKDL